MKGPMLLIRVDVLLKECLQLVVVVWKAFLPTGFQGQRPQLAPTCTQPQSNLPTCFGYCPHPMSVYDTCNMKAIIYIYIVYINIQVSLNGGITQDMLLRRFRPKKKAASQ